MKTPTTSKPGTGTAITMPITTSKEIYTTETVTLTSQTPILQTPEVLEDTTLAELDISLTDFTPDSLKVEDDFPTAITETRTDDSKTSMETITEETTTGDIETTKITDQQTVPFTQEITLTTIVDNSFDQQTIVCITS